MKYCEDDINRARRLLLHIKTATDDLSEYHPLLQLTNEERSQVIDGIHTLKNIIQYAENLNDDKLNKIIKMKKIIEEGDR